MNLVIHVLLSVHCTGRDTQEKATVSAGEGEGASSGSAANGFAGLLFNVCVIDVFLRVVTNNSPDCR